MINLYNQDCMEAMKSMEDNQFDLAIVDRITDFLSLLVFIVFYYSVKKILSRD